MLWMTVLLIGSDETGHAVSCMLFVASTALVVVAQLIDRFRHKIQTARDRVLALWSAQVQEAD